MSFSLNFRNGFALNWARPAMLLRWKRRPSALEQVKFRKRKELLTFNTRSAFVLFLHEKLVPTLIFKFNSIGHSIPSGKLNYFNWWAEQIKRFIKINDWQYFPIGFWMKMGLYELYLTFAHWIHFLLGVWGFCVTPNRFDSQHLCFRSGGPQ